MNYPKSPFFRNPLVESQILQRNPNLLKELLQWLCQSPKITTYRVNLLATSRETFKEYVKDVLSKKFTRPPAVFEIPEIPEVICIGQLPCDLLNCNEKSLNEIIVDAYCGAAVLRGAHIFAPGVIGMQSGAQIGESVYVFADLAKKCKRGVNTHYASSEKLFIGEGIIRMQRYQLFIPNLIPSGIAVEMKYTISGVPSISDLSNRTGTAILQNLPSIVAVRVLNPQPGEIILDMCAAPGNKTTHIAEMMNDEGIIIALDKTESKIKYINEKIHQNNLKSIKAYAFDSTKSFDATSACTDEIGLPPQPPFAANTFDRILLDAPCSALGNRPLLTSEMKPNMLNSYPSLQRQLFANAVQLLKAHGTLVYSTCTVTEEENELVVAWALEKFPQLELIEATPIFGGPGLAHTGLNDFQRHCLQRFGPEQTNKYKEMDTVGFFIAKFAKNMKR